jgi:phytoene dehydrogenase-like protein
MSSDKEESDVVVVGGGLAGLASAIFLSNAGRSVTLFEQASEIGGRARTVNKNNFLFNLGPHALYPTGKAFRILHELGIQFHGGSPSYGDSFAIYDQRVHRFPSGLSSLFFSQLLNLPAKLEAMRLFYSFKRIDAKPLQHVTLRAWLEENVRSPKVRDLLRAIFRVTSYADDPEQESAAAYITQAQLALKEPVLYIDGGWQVLVDGLVRSAHQVGVRIVTGKKVELVERTGSHRRIYLNDGTTHRAKSVVVATSPSVARRIVERSEGTVLSKWVENSISVKMACLDIGLKSLPNPRILFALGIDSPLYFSVHSSVAKLAPPGSALIHTAKYLGSATEVSSDEYELEELLDTVQPGWRDLVVERRFMPNMLVSYALVTAKQGGIAGRIGPRVPDIDHLYVVGDWSGPEGMLTDASLASAKRATELILAEEKRGSPTGSGTNLKLVRESTSAVI